MYKIGDVFLRFPSGIWYHVGDYDTNLIINCPTDSSLNNITAGLRIKSIK